MLTINTTAIEKLLKEGNIEEASISIINSIGDTSTKNFLDHKLQQATNSNVFQCASLSKPVFAYLVLKLIEANKTKSDEPKLGDFKFKFNLDTPLYEVFRDEQGKILDDAENPFLKKFINESDKDEDKDQAIKRAKGLTAKGVLSHTSGLLIEDKEPYKFQFSPGEYYAYSGPGILCLQAAIEELTGEKLESLAKEFIFGKGKQALNMPNSSYGTKSSAANSLETTAEEYLKFITAWINDDKLNYAFEPISPADTMKNDYFQYPQPNPELDRSFVEKVIVADEDRDCVAWGLGVGLVIENGKVIGAYHTGDGGEGEIQLRAGFGAIIDPKTKRCTEASIYLSKSSTGNGHMLAEQVLPKALNPALGYFFPTYGFARNPQELDSTNFHNFFGLNPTILKPKYKEEIAITKNTTVPIERPDQTVESRPKLPKSEENFAESTDSTKKMLHQMQSNPLSPQGESAQKTVKSHEVSTKKPTQEVRGPKEEKMEGEQKSTPTPLSTSYNPYKK